MNGPEEVRVPGRPRDDARWRETVALVAAWLVVGVPAVLGIAQVVVKSLALFR